MSEQAKSFVETKEYLKFCEFCDACAKYKYMGICHGSPGVGKTTAAKYYSSWNIIESTVSQHFSTTIPRESIPVEILSATTLFVTAPAIRPTSLWNTLHSYQSNLEWRQYELYCQMNNLSKVEEDEAYEEYFQNGPFRNIDLIIIDEVDRLKTQTFEILRDIYDRYDVGMVFIGMPGTEKRLARYPQLYSRIGFSHNYKKLNKTELTHILEYKWKELGLSISYEDYDDYDSITNIIKLSNGNFRLIQRLFSQIDRIMEINNLEKVTNEVVQAARDILIIGTNE